MHWETSGGAGIKKYSSIVAYQKSALQTSNIY
jgi:hypothetical protein